jgi:hypothetical protein
VSGALRELSLRSLPILSPSFPTPANRLAPEESESDVDTSDWLNFRRLDFGPVSGGDTLSQVHRGVDVDASSRCFGVGDTGLARLTTFGAKESGASSVLAQSLGIYRSLK